MNRISISANRGGNVFRAIASRFIRASGYSPEDKAKNREVNAPES